MIHFKYYTNFIFNFFTDKIMPKKMDKKRRNLCPFFI
jgi:hypothetical protein